MSVKRLRSESVVRPVPQGLRQQRKYWLIATVFFGIAVVANAADMLRNRNFDWSEFSVLGIMFVATLTMTLAWWKSKDDKTKLGVVDISLKPDQG